MVMEKITKNNSKISSPSEQNSREKGVFIGYGRRSGGEKTVG
jgi:hypothetical protein